MSEVYLELYISRDADANIEDNEITRLVAEFIGEGTEIAPVGSGAGCGTRDLDFRLVEPLTQRQVVDLQHRLRNRCECEMIDVLYEEWPKDEQSAEDGPTVAYSGDDVLEPAADEPGTQKILINYRVTGFTYDLDRNILSTEVRQILDDNSVDLDQRALITFAYEDDAVTRSIRYESSEDTDAVFEAQILLAFTAEFRKRHDDNGFHSADLEPFDFLVTALELPAPSAEDAAFSAEIFARLQALKAA